MRIASWLLLVLFYLLLFVPFPFWGISKILLLVVVLAWITLLVILIVKHNNAWKTHVFFSPFFGLIAFGLLGAVFDYCTGKGTLFYDDTKNEAPYSNDDFNSRYRLYRYNDVQGTYGDYLTANAGTAYLRWVNDCTLKGLVSVCGYQAKMYKPPFPAPEKLHAYFKTGKPDTVYLEDAAIGYARFIFKGQTIELHRKELFRSSVRTLGGDDVLDDVIVPVDSSTSDMNDKKMRQGAYVLIMGRYYPLIFNVYNANETDFEYQVIDADNQVIITNHYFKTQ